MTPLAEHLAELTGFRDREVLDVSLVGALADLLKPRVAAIYRVVGEEPALHWTLRARLAAGDAAAASDPLGVEVDALPALDTDPERQACYLRQRIMAGEGKGWITRFPLANDRGPAGVFEVETVGPMAPEQIQLATSVLRIYRNFEDLLDYSERDTLTGLLNRKTFDETFLRTASGAPVAADAEAAERRHVEQAGPWLGVVDIDHFKAVNDAYGHLIGDEVLLLLARVMRSCFRGQDRLYRFGGEEFLVLIRCGDAEGAACAFERLRSNVDRYLFPRVGHVTVSVGFTEVRHGDSPASAFERADRAVYYAKDHGRNQVVSHADLCARGEAADPVQSGDIELF